jgi:hypothetical protein
MKNRFFILIVFLSFPTLAFNQAVEKQRYEIAIDYINCKCAELSFKDQLRQPHLQSFQGLTNYCDVTSLNKGFYNDVLMNYFKTKGLFKNEILAKEINFYKTEYKPDYRPDDLGKFVMDTLMKRKNINAFKGKHQLSYPALEEEMRTVVFGLFSYKKNKNVDNTNEAEAIRKPRDFTDTTARHKYAHQDGGEQANRELETDEKVESERDNTEIYKEEENKSFFDKYRTYLLLGIIGIALFSYWMKRFGPGDLHIFYPKKVEATTRMPLHSDFEDIKNQLDELRLTSLSIQEDMNRLRFRLNELESKVENKYSDDMEEEDEVEELELENKADDFVAIDLSQESTEDNDILFKFDDMNQNAIDEDIDPNSALYTGIGETFFMGIPDENGFFDAREVSEVFKRPNSVYEFSILSKDGNKAEFNIYEDIANMIGALNDADKYIKPVCRTNSILHKHATKIITEKKGIAVREGNRWRVTEKALIRYK